MLGLDALTAKKEAQIVLCATADAYARLLADLPEKFAVCQWDLGDDLDALEGLTERKVVAVSAPEALLVLVLAAAPAEIKRIDATLPDKWESTALAWCAAHARIWPDKASTESTPESVEAATPNPASSGSSSQDVDTAEPAAKGYEPSPVGAVPGFPDAADPVESAPPANGAPPISDKQVAAASAQAADPIDETFIALPDAEFCDAWRNMPWDTRDALHPAIRQHAVDRFLALNTHVTSSIDRMRQEDAKSATLELETDTVGGLMAGDVPRVPDDTESPPVPDSEPNGYDSIRDYSAISGARISTGKEVWQQPIDLLSRAQQIPLDLSILPGVLQDYHGDIARRTGCDPGISVITDFAGMAVIIDDNYRVQPRENDWKFTERIGFYCLAVGDSATRKSTAINAALEYFLDINRAEGIKAIAGLREFDLDKRKHEAVMSEYLRENKKATVWPEAPQPPENPQNGVFAVKNSTSEGLRDHLLSNHNGLLLYTDEIASMLGALGKYGNSKGSAQSEMGMLLQGYDGGEYPFARAGHSVVVPNWKFSLATGTTETKLREVLSNLDDGFLQRLLLCNAVDSTLGNDTAPDAAAIALHDKICNNLHRARVGAKTVLKFTPAAVKRYRQFEQEVHTLTRSEVYPAPMRSCISRWTGTVARISLLYQLMEFAKHGQEAHAGDRISVENVDMACDFLLKFQIHQQEYFWSRLVGGAQNTCDELVNSICRWIIAHRRAEFTLRELSRGQGHGWLNNKDKHVATMRTLEDAAWIQPNNVPSKGRAGLFTAYTVNPAVHPMYEGEVADGIRALRKLRADDAASKRTAAAERRALAEPERDATATDQIPPEPDPGEWSARLH